MAVIRFGEWLPDQPDYRNPGVLTATNVVPTARGYAPVQDFVADTDALDSRPLGAETFKDLNGNTHQYAGDSAKLYERSGSNWVDRSKTGGYSTGSGQRWEFTGWNDKALAVNFSDNPQQITLGGSNFSDLTSAVQAKHIDTVGEFVVLGNTNDSSDGHVPNRVRWSGIADETSWTVSSTTLADFQDLPSGGAVQRVLGGEFGVILTERSVWRMTFVGAPTAFQFDEVLPNVGTLSPGSAVRDGNTVYFLSERGFFALDNGTQVRSIGNSKVDDFIIDDLDFLSTDRMSTVVDVANQRILWSYPSNDSGGTPDRIIVYDTVLDRWSLIDLSLELLYRAAGVSTTLEEIDSISASIDSLSGSLDDKKYLGGVARLGAFGPNNKAGALSGGNLEATIDTKEVELSEGRKTRLNAFQPLVDGGSVTAQVISRDRQVDNPVTSPVLDLSSSGRFTYRSNARYHRFRVVITGEWADALGVQVTPFGARRGERRG